jgi:peptide/nickel transport system permease protein
VAPALTSTDPNAIRLSRRLLAPGQDALLGTEAMGRDVFTRLLHGGQRTPIVGILAVTLSTIVATVAGATAGYLGGWFDLTITGLLDILLALPGLLLTLAVLGILGTGSWTLVIALVGGSWAGEARIIRGVTAGVREGAHVEAALSAGAGRIRILARHILPSVLTPILVLASLNLGEVLLVVSALSFLGLGVQPPQADWGVMLADSRTVFAQAPWLMLAPGLCIVIFALLANLAGDTLRGRLDPRARR